MPVTPGSVTSQGGYVSFPDTQAAILGSPRLPWKRHPHPTSGPSSLVPITGRTTSSGCGLCPGGCALPPHLRSLPNPECETHSWREGWTHGWLATCGLKHQLGNAQAPRNGRAPRAGCLPSSQRPPRGPTVIPAHGDARQLWDVATGQRRSPQGPSSWLSPDIWLACHRPPQAWLQGGPGEDGASSWAPAALDPDLRRWQASCSCALRRQGCRMRAQSPLLTAGAGEQMARCRCRIPASSTFGPLARHKQQMLPLLPPKGGDRKSTRLNSSH